MSLVVIIAACAADDPLPFDLAEDKPGPQIERPMDLVDLTGNSEITVEVGDNYFRPRNFIVDPGTRIVFVNVGFTPHNVISTEEGAFEFEGAIPRRQGVHHRLQPACRSDGAVNSFRHQRRCRQPLSSGLPSVLQRLRRELVL